MPAFGSAVTAKATPTRVTARSAWVTSRAASEFKPGSNAETTPTSNTVVRSRARIPTATRPGPQLLPGLPGSDPVQLPVGSGGLVAAVGRAAAAGGGADPAVLWDAGSIAGFFGGRPGLVTR